MCVLVGRSAGKRGGRAANADAALGSIPKIRWLRTYREGGAREGDCSEKASEIWIATVAVT
jgi:hypothetical protein